MGLIVHLDRIDAGTARALVEICPFGAIEAHNGAVTIGAGCKMCRLCVRKGPPGAVTYEEDAVPAVDRGAWAGVAVFTEQRGGRIHPVSLELAGKARALAEVTGQAVLAVLIGFGVREAAQELLCCGVDRVYCYDDAAFADFRVSPYAGAFADFIGKIKPSSVLVGATSLGRSLAPKVAARVHSGLTADCTMLEMKPNTDLVQIRPAFGGNIMAQIVSPNARPQFCTVRQKIFPLPERREPSGEIIEMPVSDAMRMSDTEILQITPKPKQVDIAEASAIVACGRGVRSKDDLSMCRELAELLDAQLACTRPLVECGWMEPTRQIGLSGRTVKPKLIVTVGVSGSVQFAAGMRTSDMIVAVNSDRNAPIFDIAHYGFVGDLYRLLPGLIGRIRAARKEREHV